MCNCVSVKVKLKCAMNTLSSNSDSTVHRAASPSNGKCKDDLSDAILRFSLVLTQYSFNFNKDDIVDIISIALEKFPWQNIEVSYYIKVGKELQI